MKAVVAAFNQEKALVEAFSVITNLRMELFQALEATRRRHNARYAALLFQFWLARNVVRAANCVNPWPRGAATVQAHHNRGVSVCSLCVKP